MQAMARDERVTFMVPCLQEQRCDLLFHIPRRVILGYILWSNDGTEATLRQIFVLPSERRRGIAASILRFWVTNYADPIGARFAAESPNEKSFALLVKLGYATEDRDRTDQTKCFFVTGE
jgi:GNAT superfamily N-acetyltransferase